MKVNFTNYKGEEGVEIEITDRLGPLNSWKASGGYSPDGGTAVFGANSIVGRGCGVIPCWEMHGAVWSNLRVGDVGSGVNNADNENLEASEIYWEIIST